MRHCSFLLAWAAFTAAGCGSKSDTASAEPTQVTVDKFGVTLTVPSTWKPDTRGDRVAYVSGLDGVIIDKDSHPVKTIDDARAILIMGAKIKDEKALPTGGFLFVYDEDYGTKSKPMVLPEVESVLPTPGGTITCKLQLQPSQDPAPIIAACSSMKAK